MCESLRHGVTTHNWFVHYLWDIYGGFGHNGKIIQRTLPSLPYSAITLMCMKVLLPPKTGLCITFGTGPAQFSKLPIRTSEEKHVCESLRHGVTTHNWFVHYLWDIYGGFGHNGKIIQRTLPSHTQPSRSDLAAWATFRNLTHFGRETCV